LGGSGHGWGHLDSATQGSVAFVAARRVTFARDDSSRELHLLVDELSDTEAEAALARLERERERLTQWAEDADATEDACALANAREAIREERW
jgi:hypothetical protein